MIGFLVVSRSGNMLPYREQFFSVHVYRNFGRVPYWYHIHILVIINSTQNIRKNRCQTGAVYRTPVISMVPSHLFVIQVVTPLLKWRGTTSCRTFTTNKVWFLCFLPCWIQILSQNAMKIVSKVVKYFKLCGVLEKMVSYWYHIQTIMLPELLTTSIVNS